MADASSAGRESFTWVSRLPQKGHRMAKRPQGTISRTEIPQIVRNLAADNESRIRLRLPRHTATWHEKVWHESFT
jgi:hypothetical protein